MEKQYIADLVDKDSVESLFYVREKKLQLGKNGRPYLNLQLSDKSGVIDARVWDRADDLSKIFEIGDVIQVKGQVQLFQNRPQLIVHKIELPKEIEINADDFLRSDAKNSAQEDYLGVLEFARSMANSHLNQLCLNTLQDPEIKGALMISPAAKSIHHAWKGGLINHIHSLCRLLDSIAKNYPQLNRDLLLYGAIYHDIGKIWELELATGIQYTDRGRLIGHLHMACELLDRKVGQILGFPDELADICKHIILSHHGKLEYGSPKRPKFLEAMVVAMADDLDSKISTLESFLQEERATGQKWSRFHPLFERYFLLDDMSEKLQES